MPIYEYGCPKCGEFEVRQSLSDPTLKRCPTCKSKVTKLISASAFQLKGGGWYSDGYHSKKASPSSGTSTTTESSSGGDGASKSTSTPAPSSSGSSGTGSASGGTD